MLRNPCLHQRLQEFGRQLAVVGELDEALTDLSEAGMTVAALASDAVELARPPN